VIVAGPQANTKTSFARTPAKSHPEGLFTRPKTGFTTPLHTWMQSSGGPRFHGRGSRGWATQTYRSSGGFRRPEAVTSERGLRVVGWPAFTVTENPYNTQLYGSLRSIGLDIMNHSPRTLIFGEYDVLHVHWPNFNWPPRRHTLLARAILLSHMTAVPAALVLARLRKKPIVWTVHNLKSHDTRFPGFARAYDRLIATLVDGHISLSAAARAEAEAAFPALRDKPGFVIPHGHYRDVYDTPVSPAAARRRLGIPADARVVLSFGAIRPYKNSRQLFSLFEESGPNDYLILAGRPFDHHTARAAREAAARNPRIRIFLGFVPQPEVHVLFSAASLFVNLADDALNSGSTILAMSFGVPALVREHGTNRELQRVFGPDLVHTYEGEPSWDLVRGVLASVADSQIPRTPPDDLRSLDWENIAQETHDAFASVRSG
jgi:beta-1,4-mannosyltransferase